VVAGKGGYVQGLPVREGARSTSGDRVAGARVPCYFVDPTGASASSFQRAIIEVPMLKLDSHPSGRHFLQIPGPTNVPDRVLRAIDHPTIDHRGPEFAASANGARRHEESVPTGRRRGHLSVVRHRARGRPRSSTRCRPAIAC
jgi:hypothetical protein